MQILETARYLGSNAGCYYANGAWISITQFNRENLLNQDLHAHLNPHITFLLQGGTQEKRAGATYDRVAGDIVFFHAEEAHQNSHTPLLSKNINLEFEHHFLQQHHISEDDLKQALQNKIQTKFSLLKIYNEFLINDMHSHDSINLLLLGLITPEKAYHTPPSWIKLISDYLHDTGNTKVTLQQLAEVSGIHPVTISKNFPKYFNCTLGEYFRRIKTEKALQLLKNNQIKLTDIAYQCGFADQSHFIRVFKQSTGFLPKTYQNL